MDPKDNNNDTIEVISSSSSKSQKSSVTSPKAKPAGTKLVHAKKCPHNPPPKNEKSGSSSWNCLKCQTENEEESDKASNSKTETCVKNEEPKYQGEGINSPVVRKRMMEDAVEVVQAEVHTEPSGSSPGFALKPSTNSSPDALKPHTDVSGDAPVISTSTTVEGTESSSCAVENGPEPSSSEEKDALQSYQSSNETIQSSSIELDVGQSESEISDSNCLSESNRHGATTDDYADGEESDQSKRSKEENREKVLKKKKNVSLSIADGRSSDSSLSGRKEDDNEQRDLASEICAAAEENPLTRNSDNTSVGSDTTASTVHEAVLKQSDPLAPEPVQENVQEMSDDSDDNDTTGCLSFCGGSPKKNPASKPTSIKISETYSSQGTQTTSSIERTDTVVVEEEDNVAVCVEIEQEEISDASTMLPELSFSESTDNQERSTRASVDNPQPSSSKKKVINRNVFSFQKIRKKVLKKRDDDSCAESKATSNSKDQESLPVTTSPNTKTSSKKHESSSQSSVPVDSSTSAGEVSSPSKQKHYTKTHGSPKPEPTQSGYESSDCCVLPKSRTGPTLKSDRKDSAHSCESIEEAVSRLKQLLENPSQEEVQSTEESAAEAGIPTKAMIHRKKNSQQHDQTTSDLEHGSGSGQTQGNPDVPDESAGNDGQMPRIEKQTDSPSRRESNGSDEENASSGSGSSRSSVPSLDQPKLDQPRLDVLTVETAAGPFTPAVPEQRSPSLVGSGSKNTDIEDEPKAKVLQESVQQ